MTLPTRKNGVPAAARTWISRRRLTGGLVLGAVLAQGPVRAASGASGTNGAPSGPVLVMGVVPYLSARKLAELYEPLRLHLALSLGQPVVLESAPTYVDFLTRSATGRYDLMATSPYFGRLAQLEQIGRAHV